MFVESLPLERKLEFRQLQDAHLKNVGYNLEFNDDEKFELY